MNAKEKPRKKYSPLLSRLFQVVIQLDEELQKEILHHAETLLVKEKREEIRKSCDIPINYAARDRVYADQIKNISANGLFIETGKPFMEGDEVIMTFRLDGFDKSLKLRGEIARKAKMGVGVEFKNISPHVEDMIRFIVKRMKV